MEVKVLGSGCAKCKKLYAVTEKAIAQAGIAATLTKVERIDEIMAFGVMMTPALIVNDEVKCSGRIPGAAEIANWLTTAAAK